MTKNAEIKMRYLIMKEEIHKMQMEQFKAHLSDNFNSSFNDNCYQESPPPPMDLNPVDSPNSSGTRLTYPTHETSVNNPNYHSYNYYHEDFLK